MGIKGKMPVCRPNPHIYSVLYIGPGGFGACSLGKFRQFTLACNISWLPHCEIHP